MEKEWLRKEVEDFYERHSYGEDWGRIDKDSLFYFVEDRLKEQKEKMLKILQRWRDDGGYLEEALKKRLEKL